MMRLEPTLQTAAANPLHASSCLFGVKSVPCLFGAPMLIECSVFITNNHVCFLVELQKALSPSVKAEQAVLTRGLILKSQRGTCGCRHLEEPHV